MTGPHPVGSAADEAARLFAAVEDWARTRSGLLDAARAGRAGAEAPGAGASAAEAAAAEAADAEHGLGTGATCGVCPVCSGIALLREVKPETVEHLLDAAASVVAALRSAVTAPPPEGAGRPSGVERIDVREG